MWARSPDVVGIGVRYRLRQAPDVIWPPVILSLFWLIAAQCGRARDNRVRPHVLSGTMRWHGTSCRCHREICAGHAGVYGG